MKIDSHLHVWELERFPYTWLTPRDSVLYRNYTINEALRQMEHSSVSGAVLVQADASLEETRWLLKLADQHPEILGVVGWANPRSLSFAQDVSALAQHAKLTGLRLELPVPDASTTAWETFNQALEMLSQHRLSCDLLIDHSLHDKLFDTLQANPEVPFILDHLAGVQLSMESLEAWTHSLERFAQLPNVYLKVSGYLTTASSRPLSRELLNYFVSKAKLLFGAERLMFGSDWPVCTLAGSYSHSQTLLRHVVAEWSEDEQREFMD
jgi:L-fuconolactonase